MKKVQMDIKKIFFTPPKSMFERITLFIMLTITFIIFFTPLKFSKMHPLEAGLTAALPAVSISWGWIILLRSIFRKSDFTKE
ncbi:MULTISPECIES: hypothetical protein [Alkaliphilus]|uniref:Uncharacterized protein n=2 Tax=Alkaliphilus TaxID=114627 RepID=A0A833MCK9_9FIRM|nr:MULTISPECIES: hypothetical protein [Alkaliphilus]KAB3525662.1 hypothetical protein F8153_14865 [Alkaliphilus serpentinus]KAB3530665.1 hypothetical protein F8154_13635 [Alkaliphilus pronyensis]